MYKPAEMGIWQGRIDGEAGAERWHQRVAPLDLVAEGTDPGSVLLGICSDTGVSRNSGRPGARRGPDGIRAALGNVAWHQCHPCYDAGNLHCEGDDLEGLQQEQAEWVARLLDAGHFPLLLGGGHEMALGSYLGLRRHLARVAADGVTGIINFDAHFDLRQTALCTSGTPFLQIADSCRQEGVPFRYFCLGVSEAANTAALFQRALSVGAQWLLDEELTPWNLAEAQELLRDFVAGCDYIHLSIDLDVLPAGVAPGVSAPSPRGVSLEVLEHLLHYLKCQAGTKLKLAEVAECNPDFDGDGRTAKVAARLCHLVARKERLVGSGVDNCRS